MSEKAIKITSHSDLDETKICYWKTTRDWVIYLPGCGIGELTNHTIQECDDGTITVHPSILMHGHKDGQSSTRHGHLIRGEWCEA